MSIFSKFTDIVRSAVNKANFVFARKQGAWFSKTISAKLDKDATAANSAQLGGQTLQELTNAYKENAESVVAPVASLASKASDIATKAQESATVVQQDVVALKNEVSVQDAQHNDRLATLENEKQFTLKATLEVLLSETTGSSEKDLRTALERKGKPAVAGDYKIVYLGTEGEAAEVEGFKVYVGGDEKYTTKILPRTQGTVTINKDGSFTGTEMAFYDAVGVNYQYVQQEVGGVASNLTKTDSRVAAIEESLSEAGELALDDYFEEFLAAYEGR